MQDKNNSNNVNQNIIKIIKNNREKNKIISYDDKDVTLDLINKYFKLFFN
jgi:hypothetical protein